MLHTRLILISLNAHEVQSPIILSPHLKIKSIPRYTYKWDPTENMIVKLQLEWQIICHESVTNTLVDGIHYSQVSTQSEKRNKEHPHNPNLYLPRIVQQKYLSQLYGPIFYWTD